MEFKELLRAMVVKGGSDLYLTTGAPPSMRVDGRLLQTNAERYKPGEVWAIAEAIMDDEKKAEFANKPEANLAFAASDVGRFRVNVFRQRGEVGMVIRHICTEIPNGESLGLPGQLTDLIMQKRGLILVVGATGSGKTTTLAALIDHRNKTSQDHIITIEDPIEFLHKHKRSIVNQREVGMDTNSYQDALVNVLRQAPDVIMIGEIRTRESMEHAIAFAETGHLTISTLHANNANQALDRIINFFPEERRAQLLLDLSLNLRGVISQRLIPSLDGKRVAAFEVLLQSPSVSELILKGKIKSLKAMMKKSEEIGMITFDSALYALFVGGKISEEEALKNADSKNNLRLRIELEYQAEVEEKKETEKKEGKLELSGFWEDEEDDESNAAS